jgi:hypothetical protein
MSLGKRKSESKMRFNKEGKTSSIPEYTKITDIDQIYSAFTQANLRSRIISKRKQ